MSRNIVLCCDGTGNELADRSSNVVKLCHALVRDEMRQTVFYNPGVGTVPVPELHSGLRTFIRKVRGLGFGYGVTNDIKNAYRYLMNTYQPGDRVYLFGFSRGAYTARAVAGMVHRCGLLGRGNEPLVDYAYKAYRDEFNRDTIGRFRSTFSRPCKIAFLGAWDTVASVGLFPESFPSTRHNPSIEVVRHAVAIDEVRAKFRTNLFGDVPGQDRKEVWFPGVHSDVGGGYTDPSLSNIALQWMAREAAEHGLLVNEAELPPGDPNGTLHESLTGFWNVLEWLPLRRWNAATRKREFVFYRKQRRSIPPGSRIHSSVFARQGYNPPNLPANPVVEP
ncbi:hypothetical protein F183_A35270 [Bryobacterales bacterium F-183]|nr:hypothetical protein F183_A35270 [Bryobacterales bacterium F-183]